MTWCEDMGRAPALSGHRDPGEVTPSTGPGCCHRYTLCNDGVQVCESVHNVMEAAVRVL